MTPRRTFALGALVGASFAAGALFDAALDVTGRLACWVAPWQRQAYATRHPDPRVGLFQGRTEPLPDYQPQQPGGRHVGLRTGQLSDPCEGP